VRPAAPPHYLPAVLRLLASMPPGTGYHVSVLHDSWCAHLAGAGPCDCDPELRVHRGGDADPREA
jgi:hypothetical protein